MNTIVVQSTIGDPYIFSPEDENTTYVVIDTERWRIAGVPPMVEPLDDRVTIDHQGLRLDGVLFDAEYTFSFAIGAEDAGNAFARK